MKKQYAVFGLGSFGESVAIALQGLGCEVIVVDDDMERIEDIANSVSYAMKADFGDPDVVRSLGTKNLDGVVVAVADNMEASIMATLVCKEIGVPYVISKAKNDLHATVLKKIGADAIIFPEKEMGVRLAKNLMSANFADWIALSPDYSLVETVIPRGWIGKSLQDLDVRGKYGINVVGIKVGEDVEVNPNPEKALEDGMVMILVGANKDLENI
ncbi:MAG: potassium channel family protein [Lachnospiraceae bacterium]